MSEGLEKIWCDASVIVLLTDLSYDLMIDRGSQAFLGGLNYDANPIISKAALLRKLSHTVKHMQSDTRPHIQLLIKKIQNLNPQSVGACFNSDDEGNTLGCTFFGFEDELIIYAAGFVINKYGVQNIKDLAFQSPGTIFNYFECFGYYTFIRFANDFHTNLCSILLKNKNIKKLTFAGYSYGSVFATIFSFFYQQLLNFYNTPDTMTDDEKDFVNKFYDQFIPAIKDKNVVYSKMIANIADLNKTDSNDAIYSVDSTIFSGCALNKVWVIASPALLTADSAKKYENVLGNKYTHIKLRTGDAVPDILSDSCWMYKLQMRPFFGPARKIFGHSLIIDNAGNYGHMDYAKACMQADIKNYVYVKSCEAPINYGYIEFLQTVYLSSKKGLNAISGLLITSGIIILISIIPLTIAIIGFKSAQHSAFYLLLGLCGLYLFVGSFL